MFSPRRSAQLGLIATTTVLALNVAILLHGSATAAVKSPPAPQASASVMPVTDGTLVLNTQGASLNR